MKPGLTKRLMDAIMNRADAAAAPVGHATLTNLVDQANRWREQYNPLRSLDITKAVTLRECFMRGDMADIQWTYQHIEGSDPTLMALVERRTSAIVKLDWNIKTVSEDNTGFDKSLADKQAETLRAAYERIDNLYEAIGALSMATFRGFAHLEKHWADDTIVHLEPLDQWNTVRNGYRGAWKINPQALSSTFTGLPENYRIPEDNWLIREVPRHIDWIGLVIFIRQNLCEKDWDAFCEIYDLPGCVVIGPPVVPQGKEDDYQDAAETIAEGGSGYMPNGSDVKFSTPRTGEAPFSARLSYLREQLVLIGTGGLLTMLTAPTGIGKGPSEEHADVFDDIAKSEARQISEVFQKQFDKPILDAAFPGKPVLSYWELAAEEETNVTEIVDHAAKLSSAGYTIDAAELSEKTGYKLEAKPAPAIATEDRSDPPDQSDQPDQPDQPRRPVTNAAIATDEIAFAKALDADLQPVRSRLERILQIDDPDIFRAKLAAFRDELPGLLQDIAADPASAQAIERQISDALISGLTTRANRPKTP